MSVLDYVLDGLEAELELERELGVRVVPFDRTLLKFTESAEPPTPKPTPAPISAAAPVSAPKPLPRVSMPVAEPPPSDSRTYDFVFLHHQPLPPEGQEIMAKIIAAMGRTIETAPIIVEKPVPKARIYVILGSRALAKFQPTLKGAPGQWLKTAKGADILVTYSPEYILRFPEVTPAVKKFKQDMWLSLKTVMQRIRQL